MNNSRIASEKISFNLEPSLEESVEILEKLREREGELVRVIEAINRIKEIEEWSTLKALIFDSRVESLEKQLKQESESLKLNDSEIYRLQGKLSEAKKYNLDSLVEDYRGELLKIRRLIPPTER